MKKILIVTALILGTSILSPYNKNTVVKRADVMLMKNINDKKDLGSGD